MTDTARFSLHAARDAKECGICGTDIPSAKDRALWGRPPAEYWRIKGGDIPASGRVVCCLCHVLFGFPTDGWTRAPDGRAVMAALVPEGDTDSA